MFVVANSKLKCIINDPLLQGHMEQMDMIRFLAMAAALLFGLLAGQAALFAADEPQTKTIEVSAGKVVFNVNASGAEDLAKPAAEKPKGVQTVPVDVGTLAGKLTGKLDALADWDGFKPWKIVYLLCGFVLAVVVSRGVRWIVENYLHMKIARRTPSDIDDLLCKAIGRPASMLVFSVGLFLSALPMLHSLPGNIQVLCERLFLAFGASTVAWAAYRLVEVLDHFLMKIAARTDNSLDDLIVGIIRKIVKVCIVFVSVLFIGQNILGLDITTLLAGAGVAGLAIAFAAQDTIANFFGSLMIIIDQPFTVGDYVKIDAIEGSVERVGLRSTSLRTPSGNLITMPNKNVANATVENISRRPSIQKAANFCLAPKTSAEEMEKALEILRSLFANHEGMKPELPAKIFFTDVKDNGFNIQVIVWYHPADFFKNLAWWETMNLEILRRFAASGLALASQSEATYVLVGDQKRPVSVDIAQKG